jgi:hypothetical protein
MKKSDLYQDKNYIYMKNILEDVLIFSNIYIYIFHIKNLIFYDFCHFFRNDIPFQFLKKIS